MACFKYNIFSYAPNINPIFRFPHSVLTRSSTFHIQFQPDLPLSTFSFNPIFRFPHSVSTRSSAFHIQFQPDLPLSTFSFKHSETSLQRKSFFFQFGHVFSPICPSIVVELDVVSQCSVHPSVRLPCSVCQGTRS